MIVYGRSELEPNRNLHLFLETTEKNRLCLEKLQFKYTEVTFFRYRWSSTGISSGPKKIESILKMEFPEE